MALQPVDIGPGGFQTALRSLATSVGVITLARPRPLPIVIEEPT